MGAGANRGRVGGGPVRDGNERRVATRMLPLGNRRSGELHARADRHAPADGPRYRAAILINRRYTLDYLSRFLTELQAKVGVHPLEHEHAFIFFHLAGHQRFEVI